MDDLQEKITQAEASLDEVRRQYGEDHLELSYKLDELSALLKASGRLLEAANAAAKAKAIRSKLYLQEAKEQDQKYGQSRTRKDTLSAQGWLTLLYRMSFYVCGALLLISIFFKPSQPEWQLARGLGGSSAAAALIQLTLFPIKTMPRLLKFIIVSVGTSLVWTLVGGSL